MNKEEKKRLERLQEDGLKEIDAYTLKNLTYPDLQLLLLKDPTIRKLIRQIVASTLAASGANAIDGDDAAPVAKPDAADETEVPAPEVAQPIVKIERVIEKVPFEVRVEVPVQDPLRAELAPELKLLKSVQADAELAAAWLWAVESEGQQLVRLLAVLAEWDEILSLWNRLADRCKNEQRAATATELNILQAALALHNLRWRDRAAKLLTVDTGAAFHHETMERGTAKGSTVAGVWLPGLDNAAGQLQKKPVVKTS